MTPKDKLVRLAWLTPWIFVLILLAFTGGALAGYDLGSDAWRCL